MRENATSKGGYCWEIYAGIIASLSSRETAAADFAQSEHKPIWLFGGCRAIGVCSPARPIVGRATSVSTLRRPRDTSRQSCRTDESRFSAHVGAGAICHAEDADRKAAPAPPARACRPAGAYPSPPGRWDRNHRRSGNSAAWGEYNQIRRRKANANRLDNCDDEVNFDVRDRS